MNFTKSFITVSLLIVVAAPAEANPIDTLVKGGRAIKHRIERAVKADAAKKTAICDKLKSIAPETRIVNNEVIPTGSRGGTNSYGEWVSANSGDSDAINFINDADFKTSGAVCNQN